MTLTVQIGDITFEPNGYSGWFFSTLVDWYSIPISKAEVRSRPQSPGAFGIDNDWRESAVVSMEGGYSGTTRLEVNAAKRALGVLGSGLPQTVTVTDEDGPTSRTVSVREIQIGDDFGETVFTFAIDMIAPDPNRYGPEVTGSTGLSVPGTGYVWPAVWPADWGSGGDPGRVSVSNTGSAATYPTLEVEGGLAGGVELVEIVTGSTLRLERDIPVTSTVFFDTRTGRAYLDIPANDISGFLTRRDWPGFALPAGSTRTIQLNAIGVSSGTPTLTARYSPAY